MKPILILLISACAVQLVFGQGFSNRIGKDRALFFAVDDYEIMTELRNPIKNANDIASALQSLYDFEVEVIPNPSTIEIEEKIAQYKKNYQQDLYDSNGQLLIFFTGHGTIKGKNGYFMPVDGDPQRPHRTAIEYDYWRDEINDIDCKHILVAIDACHSITFDPSWEHKTGGIFSRPGETYKDQILVNHKNYRTRIFFTSDAQGDQTPDRSTFARQFLAGLRTHSTTSPYMTSSELFANYMLKAAPTPGGGSFGDDEVGSNFLFFHRSTVYDPTNQYTQRQDDIEAYKALLNKPTFNGCKAYLSNFPNGNFKQEVSRLLKSIEEEQDWEFALLKNTENNYISFLNKHPDGTHATEAKQKLNQLRVNNSNTLENIPPPSSTRLDTYYNPTEIPSSYDSRQLDTEFQPNLRKTHIVKEGETLYSIARKYAIPIERLRQLNHLETGEVVIPRQQLYIE